MSHEQSQEDFEEMTLEIDLSAMKGSPLDHESTRSNATDDDSRQSLAGQETPQTRLEEFKIMSSSQTNESENEDDPNEEVPNIDLEERTSKPPFTCEVCAKVFNKRSRLVSHMVTHSEQKDHICGVCGKGFKNNPQLIRHSNTHSAVPNFCCNICGRGFKHNDVAKHIRRWHSGPRKTNRGGVANPNPSIKFPMLVKKKKRSKGERQKIHSHGLGRSIDDITSSPPLFQCLRCHASFLHEQDLTSHMLIHRGAKEINPSNGNNKHQCHLCMKTFTRGSGLTGHMLLHTRTERRREPNPDLRCHICDKIFTRRSGLNAHVLQHGGVLRYWCDETDCGKGFVHSYQLSRHKRSHSEVPPYSCEVCGRAFRHNDLAKHMRTHTGVKPYNCQHCGRAFAFNSSLRAHERMHLALKEHVCEVCNLGFTTFAGLRRHAKCHEPEEEKLCDFCGEIFPSKLHLSLHLQESPHCAEQAQSQSQQHQPHHQELSETNRAHEPQSHQEGPQREPGQQLQQIHQHHVQAQGQAQQVPPVPQVHQLQHLQVMPLPPVPVPQVHPHISLHKMHGLHGSHQQVTQQSHPISMHSLNSLHLPPHSNTTALASMSAASAEPVGSGPTSGQAMPVLVPFSMSLPISVPYGVNGTANTPDSLQLNHFLSWESKY